MIVFSATSSGPSSGGSALPRLSMVKQAMPMTPAIAPAPRNAPMSAGDTSSTIKYAVRTTPCGESAVKNKAA
eukprot:scaffold489_cov259-Pinguiococcus_pyrenoidosus.AAC.29